MSPLNGRTVYLLGAGASRHTGAPVLRDFMRSAWDLLDVGVSTTHKEAFKRVHEYVMGLRASNEYVALDRDNVEHVFSMMELGAQIGLEGYDGLVRDLKCVVLETLDKRTVRRSNGKLVPDPVYYHFVQRLRDATKGRFDRQGLVVDPDASDTVITFNYDVMLDFAMHFNATPAKYYLPGETGGHMPLLKLHGSVNWLECSSCKHSVQVATPSPGSWLGPGEVDDSDSEAFQMYLDMIPTMDCTGCGVRGTLDPLIVPPTWSKRIERDNFARVWRRAVQVLGDAHQIVVVGYSMPSTDTFFQYLMGMALQENSRLRRVVLVDPEADSQAYRDRYASVFGQRLRDRNMVRLSVSFLQFVERSLEAVSVGG